MQNPRNGKMLIRWVLGVFAAVIMLWVGGLQAQSIAVNKSLADNGERVASLETGFKMFMDEVRPRLMRIENKLDAKGK